MPYNKWDDVKEALKARGETFCHSCRFESRTGRKLVFDSTSSEIIRLEVENGSRTESTIERVRVIMGLGEYLRRVFITHGQSPIWREVTHFIEKDCNPTLETLELASRAGKGRTIIEKLEQESCHCSSAVVVMTGDDVTEDGEVRARENVMHEIGFFQGSYGQSRVCLLHEEGVSTPSNLAGIEYLPFKKGDVQAAFFKLQKELQAAFGSAD